MPGGIRAAALVPGVVRVKMRSIGKERQRV